MGPDDFISALLSSPWYFKGLQGDDDVLPLDRPLSQIQVS